MSKKVSTPTEGIGHGRGANDRVKSFLKSPLLGGALVLGLTVGPGIVAGAVNGQLRENAKANAQEIAEDSRDKVQSTLMKIHLENVKKVGHRTRTVEPKYFGSVQLGDHVCGLSHSAYGYLINIGKRAFLVGQTEEEMNAAIQKVKESLAAIQEQRSYFQGTLALRDNE